MDTEDLLDGELGADPDAAEEEDEEGKLPGTGSVDEDEESADEEEI